MNQDLNDFLSAASRQMAEEYQQIQNHATEDPGTAGDQGEENWKSLFEKWLPPTYQVVTKGRILSHNGTPGPQVDVLVLRPSYPKSLLGNKLYLAGGVAAAFECKTTLKAEHIGKAVQNSVSIRRLLPRRTGSPRRELTSTPLYGLIAHSHVWKGVNSKPFATIHDKLLSADLTHVQHPREMLDCVCVADLATWGCLRFPWIGPAPAEVPKLSWLGPRGMPLISYVRHDPSPSSGTNSTSIGALISYLAHELAWDNHDLRSLVEYFTQSGLEIVGALKPHR